MSLCMIPNPRPSIEHLSGLVSDWYHFLHHHFHCSLGMILVDMEPGRC